MNILSKQEIIKQMMEDAILSVFSKNLYYTTIVYGNIYEEYCMSYLIDTDDKTFDIIRSAIRAARERDNKEEEDN